MSSNGRTPGFGPGSRGSSPCTPAKIIYHWFKKNLMKETLKIFSGRSNLTLSKGIVEHLGLGLGKVTIRTFSDGELWVKFEENIRGNDVFIIQSTCGPAENLIELFLLLDAAVRASARRVTAVIQYFRYGRQDR